MCVTIGRNGRVTYVVDEEKLMKKLEGADFSRMDDKQILDLLNYYLSMFESADINDPYIRKKLKIVIRDLKDFLRPLGKSSLLSGVFDVLSALTIKKNQLSVSDLAPNIWKAVRVILFGAMQVTANVARATREGTLDGMIEAAHQGNFGPLLRGLGNAAIFVTIVATAFIFPLALAAGEVAAIDAAAALSLAAETDPVLAEQLEIEALTSRSGPYMNAIDADNTLVSEMGYDGGGKVLISSEALDAFITAHPDVFGPAYSLVGS